MLLQTHRPKRSRQHTLLNLVQSKDATSKKTDLVPLTSVLTRDIVGILISNVFMCLLSEMMFSLHPLFGYMSIESGGLGITESQIGLQMSIRAILHIVAIGAFEPLQKRLGAVRLYQLALALYPFTVLLFPCLNYLARQSGTVNSWPVWAVMMMLSLYGRSVDSHGVRFSPPPAPVFSSLTFPPASI